MGPHRYWMTPKAGTSQILEGFICASLNLCIKMIIYAIYTCIQSADLNKNNCFFHMFNFGPPWQWSFGRLGTLA
jgi:hypothetical protein